ncbi:MAG: hypothetical protein JNM69_06805 [Archangium sp.]|nr:hypothetical protein [Archangium sp.]
MDQQRVEEVFQYALALASEQSVQLGPIHLLKYAYLGDLAHAEATGESFTGVEWRFHKFGPYARAAEERIAPAMAAVRADERFVAYERRDEVRETSRFALDDEDASALERRLCRTLPDEVTTAVRRAVRTYGADTTALLQHAYATSPMLRAAPGQVLQFRQKAHLVASGTATPVELSKRAERKREERLAAARVELAKRLERAIAERSRGVEIAPPDDEVHREGMAFLHELAEVPALEGVVEFPPDIWASEWRRGPDDDDE